jgi:uncharacterized protein YbaP (TraB family)
VLRAACCVLRAACCVLRAACCVQGRVEMQTTSAEFNLSGSTRVGMAFVVAACACLALGAPVLLAQAAPRHFLWSVTHADGPPTFLVGSLHVLTAEHYPLPDAFERAFMASKVLIEEIDLDELANPAVTLPLLTRALLADGRTLEQVVSADTYRDVVSRAQKTGVPLVVIQRMKPWMVALTLVAPALKEAGFNPELGLDRYFFDKAKKAGLERRGLETMAYQLDRFDQMPLAMQEEMLKAILADVDTQMDKVRTIAAAWAKGDVKAIEDDLLGAFRESPELYERLLVERNRNWVAPVERCLLEKSSCFVVVGAAHLVGPHSLLALLREKGYRAEQR